MRSWRSIGDIVSIDGGGYVRVLGRADDMMLRGSYNVYPREIEIMFGTHPGIVNSVVMGVPDEDLGQRIVAFVQLASDCSETPDSLREYALGHIVRYKVPDKIVVVENLPVLPNGKIDRKALEAFLLRS